MNKKLFLLVTIFMPFLAIAQQWSGSTSESGAIKRAGNVGIGLTETPEATLHLKPVADTPVAGTFILFDKNQGEESGLRFRTGTTTKFFFWSDDEDNDALKISAYNVAGEADNIPRMMFPFDNKNIYMALSGGM